MEARPGSDRRAAVVLAFSFGAIAAMLLLFQLLGYFVARKVQHDVDLIAENSLVSIRLVERMGMAVLRERILTDRHILEPEPRSMQRTETEIASARSDFAEAARRYQPLATFAGEARAWNRLQAEVATAQPRLDEVLRLSRANHDTQARDALFALEPHFNAIKQEVLALVEINQLEAEEAQSRVRWVQKEVLDVRLFLAFFAVGLTLILGLRVTRLLSGREQQINRYAEALETRNRELDAFAGRVAHDLRRPLTSISLTAQRLPQELASTAVLRRGVQRMEELIADLLTLSRIDAELHGVAAEAAAVLSALRDDLARPVEAVGGSLRIEAEPREIHCSTSLLREVVWNLVDNAVKYRRPDVPLSLELSGRAIHGRYELRACDNGIGMSAEEAGHVFEPFFRGQRARSTPGTGLGLSIVKRIVEACGGTITCASRPGEGTTFVINLALKS